MNFEDQVKKWVAVDNEIHILTEKMKVLRDQKLQLTSELNAYASTHGLQNGTIEISDGRLRFGTVKVHSPLTFRYLERSLSSIIKNQEQVQKIISYVRDNRDVKVVKDIKRFSKN
jgi:hypothetical protein